MGKVIKNVVKTVVATFCGLLLLVLVVPLAASLLISVPAVQNAVVHRLAGRLSKSLGTRISIDRVDIKLINHVEVEGFYVEDFGGDTLLYVPRLVAPVEDPGLRGRPLALGRVRLTGAQIWLRKAHPDEKMNISRVVDSIRRRRTPNPRSRFKMRIGAIEGDSLTFGLLRSDREQRAQGVDFSRFILKDVRARIEDFSISGDTIRMEINSLGGVERTGLAVEELTAHPLTVSRGAITLADAEIRSQGAELRLPAIRLLSADRLWTNFGEFADSVDMEIVMRPSRVTTSLVGAFVPAAAGWGLTLDNVALQTRGVLSALEGEVGSARTLGTDFAFDFSSRGLPRLRDAHLDAHLKRLSTFGSDIDSLVHSITGNVLPEGLSAIMARLEDISLTGEVTGSMDDISASGVMVSGAGGLDLAARVQAGDEGTRLDGRLSSTGFELGRVLAVEDIGSWEGDFSMGGTFSDGIRGTLHGEIERLEFRNYTYSGLAVDGTVDGRRYGLSVAAHDPALSADIEASLDRSEATPRYTLSVDLERADLAALHIGGEDSVSVISGRLAAHMSGKGLDDANGTIELRDAVLRSGNGAVSTPLATLEAQNNPAGKLLSLRSEFVDGEFRSRTGYRDMLAYLGGFLQKYIPLPRLGGEAGGLVPPDGGNPAAASNYSILSLNVKDTERLLVALAPTAAIAEGTSARFMFNPYTGGFSLSASSEFVEYGGMLAADISLTADNAADSLVVYLSGTDIYSGRGHIPRFELHGGARGASQVDVALDGEVWRIAADSLGFETGRVGLANVTIFPVDSPGQRLNATGVISNSPSDTLHVRFNRFDLSPLGRLVRGERIDLAGMATGRLEVSRTTENPRIDADIELRGLAARGLEASPLRFYSHPGTNGGIDYRLVNENTGDDLITGSLSQQGEIDARVRLDSLDVALLDPLLGDILADTRGVASARLTLGGPLGAPRMNGYIDVPRMETTVAYTRVRYGLGGARLAVENSVLNLPRTPLSNLSGGSGDLALRVDMSNFRDITAEVDAWTNAMLVFDTGPGDSEAFYGRVFATGSVGIRSGRMGTLMNISARTDEGTGFHLPLNAKSNVSWADFVVFADRTAPPDTTDVLARKKLAYERGLMAGSGRTRRAKPLELNLTANVTPSAEVHLLIDPNLGQGITGRGEGIIDLKINPANDMFTMTGDYNISDGRFEFSMMDVFNKTFEITPGSTLRWSGAPDDALLSVDASYRVRTSLQPLAAELLSNRSVPVDCIIRLRDRLSEPEITFDISVPSAEAEARQIVANAMNTQELKSMQFLSLLTTGSFAMDNSITGQATGAGIMATGAVGFDILTNQLNNFLSSDDYDVYFRYRPQDNLTTGQFDMGFSTRLWNDRLQLEIEGNYVDDRAATSVGTSGASNLVGDVSLTWVIDRTGNLRLKVFSQSIDRMTEDQGRQESGLGLYYKRDFDTLGDIFRRNNSKFAPDSVIMETPRQKRKE